MAYLLQPDSRLNTTLSVLLCYIIAVHLIKKKKTERGGPSLYKWQTRLEEEVHLLTVASVFLSEKFAAYITLLCILWQRILGSAHSPLNGDIKYYETA